MEHVVQVVNSNVLLTTQEQCTGEFIKWFTFIFLGCNHNSSHTNIYGHMLLLCTRAGNNLVHICVQLTYWD